MTQESDVKSPIIYFDHINKTVTTIQPGPAYEKKIAELAIAQKRQATTAGQPPRP